VEWRAAVLVARVLAVPLDLRIRSPFRILCVMLLRRAWIQDLVKAIALWLFLGIGMGWYYTVTYYGRVGWPMPLPDACAPLVLYYFSVVNAATWIQAVHWLVVFPLAGILWVTILTVTAPFFGGRRAEYGWALVRFAATTLPLAAPTPLMAYWAGQTGYGFSWNHMIAVALRQASCMPWWWLTPLYVALAVIALVWQLFLYVKVFDLHGKKAILHYLVSAILLILLSCGLGTLGAFGLRWWLE
jgi:hypothetical protein